MSNEIIKSEKTSIEKIKNLILLDEYLLGTTAKHLDKKHNKTILSNKILIPFRKKNKWGYSTENKNIVIACDFDSAEPFYDEVAIVTINDSRIFINKEGRILFERKKYNEHYYQNIVNPFIWFGSNYSPYTQGILDVNGNEVISKSIAIQLYNEQDRLVVFKDEYNDDKKFGFFSAKNSKIVDCKYNKIKNYQNGFLSVGKTIYHEKYMYGFININDEFHISYKYSDVHEFACDRAGVKIGTKWGYINLQDELVIPPIYQHVRNFYNNIAQVYKSNKWGLIDNIGNVILPTIFDSIFVENDNLFGVKYDGVSGFIKRDREFFNSKVYNQITRFENGFASVKLKNKWGSIDIEGKQIIPPIYGECFHFNKYGFAAVVLDPRHWKRDIIDQNGNFKIPPKSETAVLWGNRFIFKMDNKYGCLDETGNEIIPCIWDQMNIHDNNLVKVYLGTKFYGYINRDGVLFWDD
jgi:hypothetical protein